MSFILDGGDLVESVRDPFGGGPVTVRRLSAGAWVGGAVSEMGCYYTPIAGSFQEVLDLLGRRAPGWDPGEPVKEPLLVCPFTGEDLVYRAEPHTLESSAITTAPFWAYEQAAWFASWRAGREPLFKRDRIEIIGERSPDLLAQAQAAIDARYRKGIEDGHAVADKLVRTFEPLYGRRGRKRR